jgi:hypothetical protein
MQSLIRQWEQDADQRAIFLRCYWMMTLNMRLAIQQGEFRDPDWVARLLENFAGYYFDALQAYDQDPAAAPAVWRQAHQAAADERVLALQKLLLGVNAHINYDLVFSLVDMLRAEWAGFSPAQRGSRYTDYCHVNEVIGHTIDAVQDQVLEPAMPVADLFDRLLGPLDERLISALLTRWRENVWQYAVRLLEAAEVAEQARLIREVEQDAIRIAQAMG